MAPEIKMSATVLERQEGAAGCRHTDVEVLGYDRDAKFLRCRACGQILVAQGGRFWLIRRPQFAAIPSGPS